MYYFWYICWSFLAYCLSYATDSLSDPITQKTSQWKVVALCINKVLFMSYQSDNSLTDVNVICTVLWPKTASSSSPVTDKGAPSVTEHSTYFCYKKTVNYLMHRRSRGTADTSVEATGIKYAQILISLWNWKLIGPSATLRLHFQ